MAEDNNKSPTRTNRPPGLFSSPADPLLGGMGPLPRPKRKTTAKPVVQAPQPAKPPAVVTPPPAPTVPSATAALSSVEVPDFPDVQVSEPAPRPPRPAGISLSEQPSSPAEPTLSPIPASMRLRIAKSKSQDENLSVPPPRPASKPEPTPEPTPEPPSLNNDPRGRITLPKVSERGLGPVSWEEEDGSFDLLQEPAENLGTGLMDLVPEDENSADPYDFDSFDRQETGNSDWEAPHTDQTPAVGITAHRDSYEEDLGEPPSELADLDQLPRGVIVRDEKANHGFTHLASPHTLVEDAGVWTTQEEELFGRPAPPSEARRNQAWWEERIDDENSQQGKVATLPPRPMPEPPSLLGKTRREREARKRGRAAIVGGGVGLVVLCIIAAFALLSQPIPVLEPEPQVMVPPVVEPMPEELPEPIPAPIPEPIPVPEAPEVVKTPPKDPPSLGSRLPGKLPTQETAAGSMAIEPGFLNIRAEPRAVIFMNGKNLGQTPLERVELPPGEHTFKAVAPGKKTQVRTIRVDSGQAQRIIFRF